MPYLDQILGPAVSECEHPLTDRDELPRYVFRAISEEDFQLSLQRGYHRSDGRNTYPAQRAADPEA